MCFLSLGLILDLKYNIFILYYKRFNFKYIVMSHIFVDFYMSINIPFKKKKIYNHAD